MRLPHAQLRRAASVALCALMAAGVIAASGCRERSGEPLRDSREALGTVVTITAYATDDAAAQRAIDAAFERIGQVESALSSYPDLAADPAAGASPAAGFETTSVTQFNRDPFAWHLLPPGAATVLERVDELGVSEYFSPGMLRVAGLYDFEGDKTVPDPEELAGAVRAARAFETSAGSTVARFAPVGELLAPPSDRAASYAPPAAGLDLSGASKGLALDEALAILRKGQESGEIEGAIVSAGSTTLVTGSKPDRTGGGPWQIGIEDPRDPEKVIGIVEYATATGTASGDQESIGTVSTSGDYQQSFVRDGVRYHHILDPRTGKPARGIRSLTVVGARSGLDSDILSTALFVMGAERAVKYARDHDLGLFIVDEQGRTRIVPGPAGARFSFKQSPG